MGSEGILLCCLVQRGDSRQPLSNIKFPEAEIPLHALRGRGRSRAPKRAAAEQRGDGKNDIPSAPSRQSIARSERRQNQSPVYFVSRYNGAFFSWWYALMLMVHGTDQTLLG